MENQDLNRLVGTVRRIVEAVIEPRRYLCCTPSRLWTSIWPN